MTISEQIRDDTLTLLLANRVHKELPLNARMKKIRERCERLIQKINDLETIQSYLHIIKWVYAGEFENVIICLHITEGKYYKVYMHV